MYNLGGILTTLLALTRLPNNSNTSKLVGINDPPGTANLTNGILDASYVHLESKSR